MLRSEIKEFGSITDVYKAIGEAIIKKRKRSPAAEDEQFKERKR